MSELDYAALGAAVKAADAVYMASDDDRTALRECIIAAIGAYLEGLWRPIEEAPKDETTILAWSQSHGYMAVFWTREKSLQNIELYGWATLDGLLYHGSVFSHFQSLPLPPKASKE